jgi:hypothetical protein
MPRTEAASSPLSGVLFHNRDVSVGLIGYHFPASDEAGQDRQAIDEVSYPGVLTRRWLTRLVGPVIHNLTSVFGEKFLWGHHGISFIRKETNGPPELVFLQIKNNQTGN